VSKIEPSVGRIVHVHLSGNPNTLAGIVCAVHERGINVAGFDQNGVPYRASAVRLVQPGETIPANFSGTWAEWMPYQKGQAAKLDEAMAKLDAASTPGNVGDPVAANAGADAAAAV
jgi:hypothetical protein